MAMLIATTTYTTTGTIGLVDKHSLDYIVKFCIQKNEHIYVLLINLGFRVLPFFYIPIFSRKSLQRVISEHRLLIE